MKENEHKKLIKHLEEEKTNLTRKLKLTQKMLDEQLEKINAHVSHLAQFMMKELGDKKVCFKKSFQISYTCIYIFLNPEMHYDICELVFALSLFIFFR